MQRHLPGLQFYEFSPGLVNALARQLSIQRGVLVVEEVVRSLIESEALKGTPGSYRLMIPLDRLEVPSAVQSVLAARIDRLPEREKRVLQTAAVIGKEFAESVLTAVTGLPESEVAAGLSALKGAEFVREDRSD